MVTQLRSRAYPPPLLPTMPSAMGENKRSFVLEGSAPLPHQGGRYVATKPSIAGQHAAHQLFKMAQADAKYARFKDMKEVYVKVRETTRGGDKREFFYKVVRSPRTGAAAQPREFRKPDGSVVVVQPGSTYAVMAVAEEEFARNVKKAV